MIKELGRTAYLIHAEAEGCTYPEKVMIGIVIWNRLLDIYNKNEYKFKLEDFEGWDLKKRKIKITNNIEREALIESINASFESYNIVVNSKNNKYKNVYFFNLSGNMNLRYYNLNKIKKSGFKHTFFEITGKRV